MKTIIKFIFFSFVTIYLSSCVNRGNNDDIIPKSLNYSVIQKSAFFNKNNISFSIDSLKKTLYIKLTINGLKDFPFPINKEYNDTLFKTVFDFNFYCDGKIIVSDYPNLKNTFSYFKNTSAGAEELSISSDTVDLRKYNELQILIPFYAFHNLNRGKHSIELAMSQTVFTDEKTLQKPESAREYVHLYETKPLLNARVKFDLNVPAIYKSIIYGQGLELKNDSTFSPARMDNTIWNSSYPDIYWTINYPKNEFYAQTPFEPSTDKYLAHDTFNLFHYFINDTVGFGVYDHDNLSSDDWMGTWRGSLNDLEKTDNRRLTFDNILHFDLKVKDGGLVN